ncbi:MAG: MltA domain-containing protein [Pseudomonadota bacterium]
MSANFADHAGAPLAPVSFDQLPGWGEREAGALLEGIARHTEPAIKERPHEAPFLDAVDALLSREDALSRDPRAFVARHFQPLRIPQEGFLTAYYEPVIKASRRRVGPFQTPFYRRPDDLVRVAPSADRPGDGTFARRHPDGSVGPYPDRVAIEAGALMGRGLEIAYVADPVDAFFAQVQGSARLSLTNGETVRISYHGKTGHPYTAIGKVLIERGVLAKGGATMATIRDALAADPALVKPVLSENRSFVFFRERPSAGDAFGPIAAAGLPLIAWRSLAVDRAFIKLGTPVYVETEVPGIGPFQGLMIAEDTGSAIVGPSRGDIFMGSGDEAGRVAGAMKAAAKLTLIVPKAAF